MRHSCRNSFGLEMKADIGRALAVASPTGIIEDHAHRHSGAHRARIDVAQGSFQREAIVEIDDRRDEWHLDAGITAVDDGPSEDLARLCPAERRERVAAATIATGHRLVAGRGTADIATETFDRWCPAVADADSLVSRSRFEDAVRGQAIFSFEPGQIRGRYPMARIR